MIKVTRAEFQIALSNLFEQGNSTLSNEHEQDTASPAPSAITNECLDHATDERVQHTATDQTQSAITSEGTNACNIV